MSLFAHCFGVVSGWARVASRWATLAIGGSDALDEMLHNQRLQAFLVACCLVAFVSPWLLPLLHPWAHTLSAQTSTFFRSLIYEASPESSSQSILDLRILLAVLLGASSSLVLNYLLSWASAHLVSSRQGVPETANGAAEGAGAGTQPFDIPDNACYFCIRRPATSKCGSCRLVYYCCRLCQMQAWRKHRHVCGAAASAASRIHRSRSLITPSQWRELVEYCDFVRELVPPTTVVPTAPEMVAGILHKMGAYIRQRSELVCQPMADAVWANAISMRSEGTPDRLHMAWAWGFLEASVESGSADAFLSALRINDAGAADLPRVNRWMKRGLCQALLMLNKRQEVGGFFRAAPMQQLLYF